MKDRVSPATEEARQRAAALEIVGREAERSGRSLRGVLSVVRVSEPPTQSEQRLLAAIRVLKVPHTIMPQPCVNMAEWKQRYAGGPPLCSSSNL